MLDAGHGAQDAGAVGPTGLREKDAALTVTLLLGALLVAGGMDVSYTRRDDTFLSLSQRCALANEKKVDVFLSIHCNSATTNASGFEVWTSPGQTASDPFATALFNSYGAAFPDLKKRADLGDGDPDKEAKFAVLTGTKMPAALFELEFIHTAWGENFLRNRDNLAKMAKALAAGVLAHFGLSAPAVPAPAQPVEVDAEAELEKLFAQFRKNREEWAEALQGFQKTLDAELVEMEQVHATIAGLKGKLADMERNRADIAALKGKGAA